jgi:hypothetical protein
LTGPEQQRRANSSPRSKASAILGRLRFFGGEIAGLVILTALAVASLAVSWRKWPDPLIDFGRELYTPWRLANGAVLYRDVDAFYGPLSQYFNALLFALFQPGLMVLVAANLVVFTAIVALLYLLCRRAWGVVAALSGSALFIALFGFSQFVVIGNYNYAAPYSHEVTHGLLLCLALTFVLLKWRDKATPFRAFLAGAFLGLTALLKPEILLAAGLVTVAAAIALCRDGRRPSAATIAIWALGVLLPTAGFTAFFCLFLPFKEALSGACRGWLNAVGTTLFTTDQMQMILLGLDRPGEHFKQHVLATLAACVPIGFIAGAAWLAHKIRQGWLLILMAAGLACAMAWLACSIVNWSEVGRCLLGLVLLYLLASALFSLGQREKTTGDNRSVQLARLLIALLAAALMARMILFGRIYQFGFYQAALAAVIVPAILIGEVPQRFRLGRRGQIMVLIGAFALLLPGVIILASKSVSRLRLKTLAVGQGRDRFYAFPQQVERSGKIVSLVTDELGRAGLDRTLLVLPEGVMINYLARLPSTVAPFIFFSAATEAGREEQIVAQLNHRPPDAIVILHRSLREYGIDKYGERPGRGKLLLDWVAENYDYALSLGWDPQDYRTQGAALWRRRLPREPAN